MNRPIKQIVQWSLAIIFSFLIVNLLCFIYERPVGWIDTEHGASCGIRNPGTVMLHGTEGYAVSIIDSYGYTNENKPLQDSYILVMGSSHTQGKEVATEKRFTSLANKELSKDEDSLFVFNIAADGHLFPSQIKHFSSAISAYPNSLAIILEVSSTDYTVSELLDACEQVEYLMLS